MAILVIVAGLGGLSLVRLVATQRFHAETEGLLSRLNRAEEFLMLLNIETKAQIQNKQFQLIPVGTLSDNYEELLKKEKMDLGQIKAISFDAFDGPQQTGSIELLFLDRGLRLPYGLLTLESDQGEKRYILFKGYPSPLKLSTTSPNWQEIERKELEYKEALGQSTWDLIR